MKDEELLDLLRTAAREEDRAYEAWMASPEEGGGVSESAQTDRLVTQSLEQLAKGTSAAMASGGLASEKSAGAARVGAAPREYVPSAMKVRPSRNWKNIALGGAVILVLAAGVMLVERRPHVAEVPPYVVAIEEGAESQTRGASNAREALVYRPGAEFALTLRPATRVAGPVVVQCNFVTSRGARVLALRSQANDAGVVTLRGAWPADFIGDAEELTIMIGRPTLDALHAEDVDPWIARFDSAHPPLQTLHVKIVVPSR